jgi:hypothetical protein
VRLDPLVINQLVYTLGCIHSYFAQISVVCDGGGIECIAVHMELEILFC